MRHASRICLVALAVTLSASPRRVIAQPIDLNAVGCGAVFFESVAAYLSADLDCSAAPALTAVFLNIGRLELRGFQLTGRADGEGVACGLRCQVVGPGTINAGVIGVGGGGTPGKISLQDVAITAGLRAVNGNSRVRMKRSTATSGEIAVLAGWSATIIDSTITGATIGVLTVNGPRLVRSQVQGHGRFGIVSNSLRPALKESTVTGNGTDPSCASSACADVLARHQPRLLGASACERSMVIPEDVPLDFDALPVPGTSWGVCSLD